MAEYRDEHIPLAYLITFRAYGTWLHGDKRGSVNRFHNRFGTSLIAPNERWRNYNHSLLSHSPVKLRARQRALVEEAIRETCRLREWEFWATNVRTNHGLRRSARLERFVYRRLGPVATTTPAGLPVWGPRSAPGFVFVVPCC
jgi:hypothetical protein